MNNIKKNLVMGSLLALSILWSAVSHAQTLAFPGAEGFGKYTSGGRGGKVVEVTTVNDDGPGSFRQALLEHPGEPITIVFRVAGTIELLSEINVKRSNITVAGQTAPGDGICLKGHSFKINGARSAGQGGNHGNIIIRYIRSRPGSTLARGVYGFDMENCHDVIIDHCSFSWANEECAAMYDTKNTTVQWSIVSEGLYNAGHAKGNRAYGGVWGGQYASYHHNLIAHQNSRTVRFNGARAHDTVALVDYRNNVIYNWGSANACYGGEVNIPNGTSKINLVNNYYKPGPGTASTLKFVQANYTAASAKGIGQWHVQGNVMEGSTAMTSDNWSGVDLTNIPEEKRATARSAAPFEVGAMLAEQTAEKAYSEVLRMAGATIPGRDDVDLRIVKETSTKTAKGKGSSSKPGIIDSPMAVGGWPVYKSARAPLDTDKDGMADEWEKMNGLDAGNPEDRNKAGKDGYTMLEIYLNSLIEK